MLKQRRTWLVLLTLAVTVALATSCNPLGGVATHDFGEPGSVRSNLISYGGPTGGWLEVDVSEGGAGDLTITAVQAGQASPDPRQCMADDVDGSDLPVDCGGCNWWTPTRLAWDDGASTGYHKLVYVEPGDRFSFLVTGTDTPVKLGLRVVDGTGTLVPDVGMSDTGVDYEGALCGGGE